MFKHLTGSSLPTFHSEIPVMMGRRLIVPVSNKGVCWFTFADLCEREKGAADYASVSKHFHTVILQNVPKLTSARHDRAKRFITLIDELYEHKTRLICSSEVGQAPGIEALGGLPFLIHALKISIWFFCASDIFDLFTDLTVIDDANEDNAFDLPKKNLNGMVIHGV